MITRRQALFLGLGAVGGLGTTFFGRLRAQQQYQESLADPKRDFSVTGDLPLGDRALANGLLYGAAVHTDYLAEPDFESTFWHECKILVPENELQSKNLRPTPDQFDFTKADQLSQFAREHNLRIRGHSLLWHILLPDWFIEIVNAQNAEQFLINHIQTVAGRYSGQMHSWDVLNEGIEPGDDRPDGLKKTPWLEFLGPEYIEIAFRTAAEADPGALLVYNDYGIEYETRYSYAKRRATLRMLEQLKMKGVPIHAVGIQSHLNASAANFNPERFREFLRDIASLDLKILITELDVTDRDLPVDSVLRDRIIASVYEDYLAVVLDEPATIAVLTWGLSDRHTWLSWSSPREDNLPVRPLPLDAQLNRKLAWNAIARAFDNAPNRD